MDADWVNSPAARRILVHWADPRPAWLWAADGSLLLWRNGAARLFNARLKKSGLKLAPDPVPIRGQLARLVRLGAPGRSSLSRIQFLAGDKPVSTTCSVTPIEAPGGRQAVLLVAVDPIEPELLALAPEEAEPQVEALLPDGFAYLLVDPQGRVSAGSRQAAELIPLLDPGATSFDYDGNSIAITRLTASPQGHRLLLLEGLPRPIDAIRAEEGITPEPAHALTVEPEQPHLPMALPETAPAPAPSESVPKEATPPAGETLSSLFDRLVDSDALYGELTAADDLFVAPGVPVESEAAAPTEPRTVAPEPPQPAPPEPDMIAAVIEFEDDIEDEPTTIYRVVGRGFTPLAATAVAIIDTGPETEEAAPDATPAAPESESRTESESEGADLPVPPANAGAVERLSRYNFDELSRILTDRVGSEPPARPAAPSADDIAAAPLRAVPAAAALNEGALINIAAETFVLNRLPLGILVFRDQQVLFANRALTDLVGYETIDSLRAAGIAAIFPGDDAGSAGPVTQLVRRDGSRIPVTARLQSITWQGRPALMLSASAAEPRLSGEAAVRGFAETLAAAREDGFLSTDRAGIVTQVSDAGLAALARPATELVGAPLVAAILDADAAALRAFLERSARFAETVRPSILLRSTTPGVDILLFAEGQAGIVSGYFGFVSRRDAAASPAAAALAAEEDDADPAMLARISRGVRRPLNTIIGFADLIRSTSFGTADAHRAVEYARDIKTAGQEIAVLVDELDDYSRLKTGKYASRPAELDLSGLLDSCVVRVRGHASAARVLVRSAISERLPKIRADRASLGQAILNLLASAIDQTPAGAQVILSAQPDAYGGVAVNVRDSGLATADPGERFVVFRDGVGKDGETLAPVRSSVGLALTRSLLAVNACTLSVDPAGAVGTLFSITVPADLVAAAS